jgi:hypothetical protein
MHQQFSRPPKFKRSALPACNFQENGEGQTQEKLIRKKFDHGRFLILSERNADGTTRAAAYRSPPPSDALRHAHLSALIVQRYTALLRI